MSAKATLTKEEEVHHYQHQFNFTIKPGTRVEIFFPSICFSKSSATDSYLAYQVLVLSQWQRGTLDITGCEITPELRMSEA